MKISTSYGYHGRKARCPAKGKFTCHEAYCKIHRLLYSECEVARRDYEGSGREVYMFGDCPQCQHDSRMERIGYAHRF